MFRLKADQAALAAHALWVRRTAAVLLETVH